jgi:probable selenium-dependent hydroxylase accessory protein YqeC
MFYERLPIAPGAVIALVGAGGKTMTMVRLGAELAAAGLGVVATTTTHIYPPQPGETDHLVLAPERAMLRDAVAGVMGPRRRVTAALGAEMVSTTPSTSPPSTGARTAKLRGLPPAWVADLRDLPGVDVVLVEADGAKLRHIKAPAHHEPALPASTTLLLAVVSAAALGAPLDERIAHRPERVAAVTGLAPGAPITPEAVARLMTSDVGGLKGLPAGAAAWLLLTHVTLENIVAARRAATLALATGRLAGVLLASLNWSVALPPPGAG